MRQPDARYRGDQSRPTGEYWSKGRWSGIGYRLKAGVFRSISCAQAAGPPEIVCSDPERRSFFTLPQRLQAAHRA
jgi:hypothetical protein